MKLNDVIYIILDYLPLGLILFSGFVFCWGLYWLYRKLVDYRDYLIEEQEKERKRKYRKKEKPPRTKEDEYKRRWKEEDLQKEYEYNDNEYTFMPDEKVVKINKPVGRWTSMIINEQRSYLQAFKDVFKSNDSKKIGFWQALVIARRKDPSSYHKSSGR